MQQAKSIMLYCPQAKQYMSQEETNKFIEWVDAVEAEKGWTDNKWTTLANLSASVLNNARNKGVIPKWDACQALAIAADKSPITVFRKAGLLPEGGDLIKFDDWQHLIVQLMPDEEDELRNIAEMKIERRQKNEQSARAKNFKPQKV